MVMPHWDWVVRGYYVDDVAPPREPGGLAIETVHRGEWSRDLEVSILRGREDIGRVEVEPYSEAGIARGESALLAEMVTRGSDHFRVGQDGTAMFWNQWTRPQQENQR